MRCQCGASIPDNVEYCPYCGKRQFSRTRPEKLTGGSHIEPFQGVYLDGGKKMGCVGTFFSLAFAAAILGFGLWFLWQDGDIQYLIEWFHSIGLT